MTSGERKAAAGDSERREALVVSLAEAFSERRRRGERPTVDEYVALHPALEAEIREMFPMLCVLEELGPEVLDRAAFPGVGAEPFQRLGEYRIIREIGRGGMGVVYEAEQESLHRQVALKALPFQAFHDKQQIERFHREAQAAARLHHTNIVPVFGVGEDRGVHYYVMQFIRGQTLAQVLQEVRRLRVAEGAEVAGASEGDGFSAATVARTLVEGDGGAAEGKASSDAGPPDTSTITLGANSRSVFFQSAARIALQAAEALAYAHNEGILHRDIKPSNLLLDLRGILWITDFGLAKMDGSGELTQSGALVGTIRYMAPERFRGAGDARSDVYSLGITLYELLTLRPAFPASDRAEVMRDVVSREPVAPRRLDPAIPRDLETIVLKAIAKEPGHRYPSAASLADDLRHFIHLEPVSARRASPPERLWRWSQRNPSLATATALITVLLVALAVGGIVFAARERAGADRAHAGLVQAKLEESRAWRLSREPGARTRSLAALREAVTPGTSGRVRSEIIGVLARVDLEESYRRDTPGTPHVYSDELLTRFAVPLPDGGIRIHEDMESKVPVAELPGEGRRVSYIFLSRGGAYLATAYPGDGHDTMVLWSVEQRRRLFETRIASGSFRAAFDDQGERFAFLDGEDTICILSPCAASELQRLGEKGRPNRLSFAPGGRRLAAAGFGFNQSSVLIFDVDTGKVAARLQHPHLTYSVAWHPGGRWLAVGCHDFKVHIWDALTGTRKRVLEGHSAEIQRLSFSHGGRFLASAGWDNRTLLWEAATGDLLIEAGGGFTAFSGDDRLLGFEQGNRFGNLWRVNGGECYRALDVPTVGKGPQDLDISTDGAWLAVASAVEGVRLWSLASPDEPYELRTGTTWSMSTRFQRDGAALWVAADEGLFRWPISRSGDAAEWRFGPPECVSAQAALHVSISRDARRVATLTVKESRKHILVHDLDRGPEVAACWPHAEAARCEISPGGRWVVSTTFQGQDVRVWDISSGSLAHAFETGTARACFSLDERWLAISGDCWIAVYETGTWEERFKILKATADRLGGALTFSADGRFLAAALSRSVVALLRAEDGAEVAHFQAPRNDVQISHLCLDDEQRFLAAASSTQRVMLWDLRALRLELRAMGLDWSPDEPLSAPPAGPPSRVRVDCGSVGAGVLTPPEVIAHRIRIIEARSRRVELEPGLDAYRSRASAFEEVGDWASALADVDRALEAAPDDREMLTRRAALRDILGHSEIAPGEQDAILALYREQAREPQPDGGWTRSTLHGALRARARRHTMDIAAGSAAMYDWKLILELVPCDVEASGQITWLWIVERCAALPGQPDEEDAPLALACAKANYERAPENAVYARDLGAVLYHLGRLDEAKPLLEDAWCLNPQIFSAVIHLAMIEHRHGNATQARRILDEAAAAGRSRLPEGATVQMFFETILAGAETVLAQPVVAEGR